MRSDVSDDHAFPPGYNIYRKDRESRGGGVAVLIKRSIEAVFVDNPFGLECACLRLSCWGFSFILYALYRPPDAGIDYVAKLRDHMLQFQNSKIILIGDFNFPGVNWERFQTDYESNKQIHILFDIMLTHDLIQLVKEPTRVNATSSSVLDLVFVHRDFRESTVTVEKGLSDHHLVCTSLPLGRSVSTDKCSSRSFKDYSQANDECIIEHLESSLDDFDGDDVCALWNKFKEMCQHCVQNFVPNKRKRVYKHTPWVTRKIIHLKRRIKRLKKRHVQSPVVEEIKNTLAREVRGSKDYYFKTLLPNFIKNDPSKFWNYISEKKKPVKEIVVGGSVISDPQAIAQHFNQYFQSVFSDSCACMLAHTAVYRPSDVGFISYSGVLSMLLNLNTKKSCGPDSIPNIFLRRYAESLAKFLVVLFRTSLMYGELPEDWKIALVVPIFKKGDRLCFQNYRPISLTSSCCKLMEHIVATRILEYLNDHNILTGFQHGFRKGYSTVTQLVTVFHSFAHTLDNTGQIDAIFLDFSKAFDKVPHDKLILKMRNIGLPEILVTWVANYLTNRKQLVIIDGIGSGYLDVTSGVPQGSVLGPLLFILYINDIVNEITTGVQIRLFADDAVLFRDVSCCADQCELNTNLTNILEWCKNWGMVLNADKTLYLRITRKKVPYDYQYTLGTSPLKQVTSHKYLGVTLTSNLSWNLHIDNICSSAFRKLCFLKHKLRNSPSNVKLLSYFTFIRPKLEYACIVWDPYTNHNIRKIERIQRKAVRFIYSKYSRTDSPSQIMLANKIPSLESRRKCFRLDFLSSLSKGALSIDPSPFLSPLQTRPTRHHNPNAFAPYFAATDTFKYSFFPRTIQEWNELPPV